MMNDSVDEILLHKIVNVRFKRLFVANFRYFKRTFLNDLSNISKQLKMLIISVESYITSWLSIVKHYD